MTTVPSRQPADRPRLSAGSSLTVSIGLAARRDADRTIEQIIARADNALYRAKAGGRNRVVVEEREAVAVFTGS